MKTKRLLWTWVMLLLALSQTYAQSTNLKLIVTGADFQDFISGNLTAFKGSSITKSFTVRNTGNQDFTGEISFTDEFGSALDLQEIQVSYEGTTIPAGTDFYWKGISPNTTILNTANNPGGAFVSPVVYSLVIVNLPPSIGGNKGLVFSRKVAVNSCIDSDVKGTSKILVNVCDNNGANCIPMTDAWQSGDTRLIQRISKRNTEFVQVFNYTYTNNDFCTYTGSGNAGVRHYSQYLKLKNTTSGDVVYDFKFLVTSSGQEAIPLSSVKIYPATYNSSTGQWQHSSVPLTISAQSFQGYQIQRTDLTCVSDPIYIAAFPLGDITGDNAFFMEFDVLNCQPIIDLNNLEANGNLKVPSQDGWTLQWRGKDDCGQEFSSADVTPETNVCGTVASVIGDPTIQSPIIVYPSAAFGATYTHAPYNTATYIERVTSLFENGVGNCRIANRMTPNTLNFTGACYSYGFNYDYDHSRVIVVLKTENGLQYHNPATPSGSYFSNLQFRTSNGRNWQPLNPSGSSSLYGIPSAENAYNYTGVHMFEFDLNQLYQLYSDKDLTQYWQKRDLLLQYLNESDLVYALEANCTAYPRKELINYTVEMYIVMDTDCSTPMVWPSSKITKDAKIMCPGCMFPGGAGRFAQVRRQNFGLTDADDNGLPDDGSALALSTVEGINSDVNPDNDIRTNFGIQGDRVKMSTRYYLTGSEECHGVVYDDMMIGPLRYSYLRLQFPDNKFQIDNTLPVKVTIRGSGVDYIFNVPLNIIMTNTSVDNHLFTIDVNTINAYKDPASPALPAGFRFRSHDDVQLDYYMNIIANASGTAAFEEIFFVHNPFFASTPASQYVRDFPQFECDATLGAVVKDPAGNVVETIPTTVPFTDPMYTNTWLLCEGYETVFNLVKVYQDFWGSDWTGSASDDKNCTKSRSMMLLSVIGDYNSRKIFQNEFRRPPIVDEIDFPTPEGYRVSRIDLTSEVSSNRVLGYPYDRGSVVVPASLITNGTQQNFGGTNFINHHVNFSSLYKTVTDVDRAAGLYPTELRYVDEHTIVYTSIYHEAVCKDIPAGRQLTLTQAPGTSVAEQPYKYRSFFDMDPVSGTDMFTFGQGYDFATPQNALTSTIAQTGVVSIATSQFNIPFGLNNGSYIQGSPARNPYVTIEYDNTIFQPISVTSTVTGQVTEIERVTSGNITRVLFKVDPDLPNIDWAYPDAIRNDASVNLSIIGGLSACFEDPNNPAKFKVRYGWNCNEWPQSLSSILANDCFYSQPEEIKVFSIESGVAASFVAATSNPDCSGEETIGFAHTLTSTGGQITELDYTIDLPQGLTLDLSSISFGYGTIGIPSTEITVTNISTPGNTELYQIHIGAAALSGTPFAGAVIGGDRVENIVLFFLAKVASGCNAYNPTLTSSITVNATSFCGEQIQNISTIVPQYTACPGTFTVDITGGNLVCANEGQTQPVLLTATVPPISATNCYTGPLTFEWNVLGNSTIIGTGYTISVTPTVTTTYEVTVHDAAGRTATDQYTVTVGYEYQIGNVNWVCGTSNKNICVPVNAVVPVHNGIIGMDFCLKYDKRFVSPVTTINNSNLGTVVIGPGFPGTYAISVNTNPIVETDPNIGYAHVSIYYNSNSPGAQFTNQGLVICVPFTVVGNPGPGNGFDFTMCEMYESYTLHERPVCWGKGRFEVTYNTSFNGQLEYYQPHGGTAPNYTYNGLYDSPASPSPAKNIITVMDQCSGNVLGVYRGTNYTPYFNVPITATTNVIKITRDIDNSRPLNYLNYVNARDTRAMEFITTRNTTGCVQQNILPSCPTIFVPTPGQMIAADVNISDSVRANDITLLQRRMINVIQEFPQVPNLQGKPSLDWRFIDPDFIASRADFVVSSTYPFSDGAVRYWRDNVPDVPECLSITAQCANSPRKVFRGILLGDVINYSSVYTANSAIRTNGTDITSPFTFTVDLYSAIKINDTEYDVPVYYHAPDTSAAYGFDLGLEYNADSVTITEIEEEANITAKGSRLMWNDDVQYSTIRSTNYTPSVWSTNGICYYLRVRKYTGGELTKADIKGGYGMINGDWANIVILGKTATTTGVYSPDGTVNDIRIVPSPVVSESSIEYWLSQPDDASNIIITNALGQVIMKYNNLSVDGRIAISSASLEKGVYFCTLYDMATGRSKTVKFTVE